ncbi:hypothetical protein EDC45_0843 [Mesocricetibacter intestinalis]|uniref:Uncharacterized protein n=1 Tax=Mesocricetibacter intestinalis TaxID=1521930 RepID=A0A4R6VEL3_9PAST|nr:hypothetical protein [Mesocricetibacter intestinalis]TDQ59051.1 hypothetical protein EDC45_0843 [Mesocricetibacter intestinalis]
MAFYIIGSLLVSFLLSKYLFVGVSSGWVAYGITSLISPDWAGTVGIIVGIVGFIARPNYQQY